jgi:hypothetical protein
MCPPLAQTHLPAEKRSTVASFPTEKAGCRNPHLRTCSSAPVAPTSQMHLVRIAVSARRSTSPGTCRLHQHNQHHNRQDRSRLLTSHRPRHSQAQVRRRSENPQHPALMLVRTQIQQPTAATTRPCLMVEAAMRRKDSSSMCADLALLRAPQAYLPRQHPRSHLYRRCLNGHLFRPWTRFKAVFYRKGWPSKILSTTSRCRRKITPLSSTLLKR